MSNQYVNKHLILLEIKSDVSIVTDLFKQKVQTLLGVSNSNKISRCFSLSYRLSYRISFGFGLSTCPPRTSKSNRSSGEHHDARLS